MLQFTGGMLDNKLINNGDVIAVALSGGKDSVALLYALSAYAEQAGVTVKAINVEHGIRGETSLRDSAFVADLCSKLRVELKTFSVDCIKFSADNGYSLEEGARILRYDCFYSAIDSGFCTKVATAHHLSDSVETLLFNLFRGASVSGVTGIAKSTADGKIIRPFARTPKSEIEKYVKDNDLPFVDDETNFESVYTRNYIRNEILPIILAKFPEAEKAIGRFAEISASENAFLDEIAKKSISRDGGAYVIPIETPECLFSRAVIFAMKQLGVGKDYSKVHVDAVSSLKTLENGAEADLPKGIKAVREYDDVTIYLPETEKIVCETPFGMGKFSDFVGDLEFSVTAPQSAKTLLDDFPTVLVFDADKIPKGAVVRCRRAGDAFRKFGGAKKSLNDYFTDKKIPIRKRDSIPLVCVGSEVYLVCGVEISDNIKLDEKSSRAAACIYRR